MTIGRRLMVTVASGALRETPLRLMLTRSRTLTVPVADRPALAELARELLLGMLPLEMGVRLIGIALSSLTRDAPPEDGPQLSLI